MPRVLVDGRRAIRATSGVYYVGRIPDDSADATPTVQGEQDQVQGVHRSTEMPLFDANGSIDERALARVAIYARLRGKMLGREAKPSSLDKIVDPLYQSLRAQLKIIRLWRPDYKMSPTIDYIQPSPQEVGFGGMTFAEFLSHTGLEEEFEESCKLTNQYLGKLNDD